jgi:hypothetical protein
MTTVADNAELLALKQRKLTLTRERLRAVKENGLAFYRPSPKQDAFHRSTSKRRMICAGNRFGKSTMGCAEDLAWLRGERPWYPKGSVERTAGIPRHPVKGLVITTDWDKVDEIWTSERGDNPGKIWKFLPKGCVVSKKRNHSGAIDTLEIKSALYDGTSLLRFDTVKSFMANPQGSESSDWDFIHVDEPCPESMFKAAARGLMDRGGNAWFTLTPLKEFWINDFFFPQDTGGLARDGVWAERATTHDNPYLSAAAIKDFEDTLTDEEKQCRLHGIPMHLAGLVYKSFSWDRHVLKALPHGWLDWTHPPLDYTLYVKIDPHPQTPHAVLFCAVAPTGERFYYYDMFKKCGIAELAKDILAFTKGYRLQSVECDPLGFIEHPITGTSMATEFGDHGLYVDKATKALAHGIVRVNQELAKRDPQEIYFSPYAKRTLWEIQRYAWDDKNDRPVDADDHMMENLYRNELSDPVWVDMGRSCPEIRDTGILTPNFRDDEPLSLAL